MDQPGGLLLVGEVEWHLADDLPILVDYGVVDPAAVAAASGPALGGVTLGARVEATLALTATVFATTTPTTSSEAGESFREGATPPACTKTRNSKITRKPKSTKKKKNHLKKI